MFFTIKCKKLLIGALGVVLCSVLLLIAVYLTNANKTAAVSAPVQPEKHMVYLTFDDGPSNITPELLAVLKQEDVKATFFVTAQLPECFPYVEQAYEDGHLIALHSYTHKYKEIYADSNAFWSDVSKLNELIYDTIGVYSSYIRFPGGSSNTLYKRYGGNGLMEELVTQCAEKGITYFDWNVDTKDAEGSTKSVEYIVNKAVKGAKEQPYAIILMHDGPAQKTAPEAVRQIIIELKTLGYEFDTLDHMAEPVHHSLG